MAFGGNNRRNNQEKINTTTRVIQMYNPQGEDAGTLTLGFWNNFISVRLNPALPENQRGDGKMYDYDKGVSFVMNAETAITLNQGIALVEKHAKDKKNLSASVRTGEYIVKVGYGDDYDGINGFYLGVFQVNEKGKATGSLFYPFQVQDATENTLLVGYDEDTGKAKKEMAINTQWKAFKNFFKLAETELINGGAHGTTTTLNYWITAVRNALDVMKGLIEMTTLGGGRGGNNGGGNNGGGGGMSGGFNNRRRRDVNLGGNSGGGNSGGGNSRSNSGGGGSRRGKATEQRADNVSDIEQEMMDEIGDIDDME